MNGNLRPVLFLLKIEGDMLEKENSCYFLSSQYSVQRQSACFFSFGQAFNINIYVYYLSVLACFGLPCMFSAKNMPFICQGVLAFSNIADLIVSDEHKISMPQSRRKHGSKSPSVLGCKLIMVYHRLLMTIGWRPFECRNI